MQNIKYSFLFLSLLGLFSCKDIEKNPSLSCDYDYISTEDGKCVSREYYTEQMRSKLNTNVFSNLQLSKHLSYDNYYNYYKVNTDSINQLIRPGSDFEDVSKLIVKFSKVHQKTNQFINEIEADSEKSYYLDEDLRKLKSLSQVIKDELQPKGDLVSIIELHTSNFQEFQDFLNRLRTLVESEDTFVVEYNGDYQNRGFHLHFNNFPEVIKSQIRESLESECEMTMDICIVELKSETRRLFPNLYYQLMQDL